MPRSDVWLETWESHERMADGHALLTFGGGLGATLVGLTFPAELVSTIDRRRMHERARLASAAPDLVRLVLEIEWEGPEGHCASCRASRYDDGRHRGECELHAALRKAGLRR